MNIAIEYDVDKNIELDCDLIKKALIIMEQKLENDIFCRKTSLVISNDVARSTLDRDSKNVSADYSLKRGTGIVTGVTVQEKDSSVSIITHLSHFLKSSEEKYREQTLQIISHESVHALLMHSNESFEKLNSYEKGIISTSFYALSTQIAEEYVCEFLSQDFKSDTLIISLKEVRDVFKYFLNEIKKYNVEKKDYDIEKASVEVYSLLRILFIKLAYFAAILNCNGSKMNSEIDNISEWKKYMSADWQKFLDILQKMPKTKKFDVSKYQIEIQSLANFILGWCNLHGIVYSDDDEGGYFFALPILNNLK